MTPALELTWVFTPTNLFEAPFTSTQAGYEVSFQVGSVVATIQREALEADPTLRAKVELHVANVFLGVQVQSHTAFELSKPGIAHLNADGSKGFVIECEPGRIELQGGRVDLRYTREDGTIVDTREERIRRKRTFGQRAATLAPNDETLSRMLRSYGAAVRDSTDELIHLYEIRDLLAARFRNKATAVSRLHITDGIWSRLGQLCNDLPLKEGRHRGKAIDQLRSATEDELTEARELAATLIEAYMRYIDESGPAIGG